MTQFHIFYDKDYSYNLLSLPAFQYKLCYFDKNVAYGVGPFYVATSEKNIVCLDCIKAQDPQILNIIKFITAGKSDEAKLKKFNMGMEALRKACPENEPNTSLCPICKNWKVTKKAFNGHYGLHCSHCGVGYVGNGIFELNAKKYNLAQIRKVYKMKAFT